MKTNTFFEELKKAGEEYGRQKEELKAKRDRIIESYGYGSDELKAWKEEEKAMQVPYGQGAWKAYRAWMNSDEILILDDFLWDREIKEFTDALQAAGITEFLYTNQSTALMENLHALAAAGWNFAGLETIEKTNHWGECETIKGIRLSR